MEYEKTLLAAAESVLAGDCRPHSPPHPSDLRVTATLKPHQVDGVSWLIRRYLAGVNVILGDEMGLGKTLQAISFLNYLKMKLTSGPFLVLCPLSVTDGWMSEFAKFCPTLKVLRYVGDKEFRITLRRTLFEHVEKQSVTSDRQNPGLPFDVLLTTYDVVLMDQDFLSQIPWHFSVIDEAQRLKNSSSVLYTVLEHQFIMPRCLLMTGTPLQNNLSELWALMHFCMPSIFGTVDQFLSTFGEAESFSDHASTKSKGRFKILKYVLRAFMLRRTKNMLVESGSLVLPPLTEITMIAPLAALQKKVYMSILRRELSKLLAFSAGATSHQSLQNIVIQLRKACSHPYLFNGIEPEPFVEGEHLVEASGKLIILDLLLQKLHNSGHRVLLFAQMTHTLDILQDFLEFRKYTYERLDGSVRAEERFAAIRSFSTKPLENHSSAFVFIISTRAGGVGLNLVAADTVIFYEQDWNPQVDKQALQRAHRIGQANHVLAINLVTGGTVEEVIMRRAERKLQLSNEVIGVQGAQGEGEQGPEDNDMRSLIFGLRAFDPTDISSNNSNGINMVELGEMTDKVISMRHPELVKDAQKFEVSSSYVLNKENLPSDQVTKLTSVDPELDEAAYQSWVEKFKETSQAADDSVLGLRKRESVSDVEEEKREARPKKAKEQVLAKEEKKLLKWEALGYTSLAVKEPISRMNSDMMSTSGSVQFVNGDCTKPSKLCPGEGSIIFSCVDNSGKWGHGGMFDALANLSDSVPGAYHQASDVGDLHLGDLHLIRLNDSSSGDGNSTVPRWVALAVVQSYNPRRKVPRSNISVEHLEACLAKTSFSAAQNSASLHMPRIGYQDGSQRSEWYAVQRLLQKYSSICGINIYVYYFRRPSRNH